MNKSRFISLTFVILFHIMFISVIVQHLHDSSTYCLLVIYIFLMGVFTVDYKTEKKYKAILDAVYAEHKLYGKHVTVLQSGYIRMRIDRVAGGTFSFKYYLQIFVNVPPGKNAQTTKVTMETINRITEDLHSEGLLVSCQMSVISEDDNPRRVYPLYIVVNENITPARFGQLYNSLMKAITDNGCNDIEHFTITGTAAGTIYKHYRGNLCVGTIECEHGNRIFFNSYIDRPAYVGNNEREHSENQYNALKDSIGENRCNMTLEIAAKHIRPILKKTGKGIRISMYKGKNDLYISISKRNSSEDLHLTKQNGLWWIYSYGNMIQIPVLSTESEAEATSMMVRLVTNLNNKLQNRQA